MFESIASGIVRALGTLNADAVTGVIALTMALLFTAALTAALRQRAVAFYRNAPTLLTTLGILGTFLGIATGLLDFDANHIESSIPLLLNGLKIAFTTSIVGILLAAVLRLVLVLGKDGRQGSGVANGAADSAPESVDFPTLIQRLTQISEAQLTAALQLTDQIARLDDRLVETLERQHQEQIQVMRRFAEELSEMGSRQLIAALESVIRDFNANLGEQFGENFRRLDASVEKLVEWQDQYRRHMEGLGAQLDCAIGGITQSHDSLKALTQQARQISTHVEDQESVMRALRRESMELEALLGSIADLRDRAKEAFPAIDQRLGTMLESIEGAVLSALSAQQRLGRLGVEAHPLGATAHDLAARAQV
jgi:hypothetical protein